MTQYFLSLPHDSETEPTMESIDPAELEQLMAEVGAFNTALQDSGAFRFAGGLMPPSTATTVDATGDGPEFTPGPFATASEYLGGFWVIEADNDDDAIGWAKRASRVLRSRVEVRALQEAPPA
ncbi:YCII-related protein [Kribbella flavida DSM 17836]|uniref:YCII-related protein n=1 Tax=Kribbella flavida (strain DSM 17836 / JCM 10339 / NBRC 14399) TaxID=479435 RepID=D2PWH6_KRIFD|nr:YciI family protein [Kribbella flavida]ADB33445.1 YCII-related protein [Kribbella flavida DSM 17836]